MLEGAPHLKAEHLPVFDCAFKPAKGSRSIAYTGHLRMLAAVQPYISGAISKTINMPEDSTPDDILQAYVEGWQLGLKAIAIYRDNCKRSQPLSTRKDSGEAASPSAAAVAAAAAAVPLGEAPRAARRKLLRRASCPCTHKFSINEHEGYITVGVYEEDTSRARSSSSWPRKARPSRGSWTRSRPRSRSRSSTAYRC